MIVYYLLAFCFGLLSGWVLNICIRRISKKEGIQDLSKYPLVEILTGLVFISLFYKYGFTVQFFIFAFLMSILMVAFFIDLGYRIIPNGLILTGLAGGIPVFVYNMIYPLKYYGDHYWWNPILGMVAVPAFFLIIALAGMLIYRSSEVLGMGDIKMFAPIGLFLGWKMALVALLLSIILGGVGSLILLVFGRKGRKDTIPFGPFIVVGTYSSLLWGWEILNWYLR